MTEQLTHLSQIHSNKEEDVCQALIKPLNNERAEYYLWMSNRLLRCHSEDHHVPHDTDEENGDRIKLSPFVVTSCPHTRSHVHYVWNKLFTYPCPLLKLDVRFVGPNEQVVQDEMSRWIASAINLYAIDNEKRSLLQRLSSLQFLCSQLLEVSQFGGSKRRAISSIEIHFNQDGVLKGFNAKVHWIDNSSCLKSSAQSYKSPFKIFSTLFRGLKASEVNSYKITADMMNVASSTDTQVESMSKLIDAFDCCGLNNEDIDHVIRIMVAIFHLNEIHCDEYEGKLRMFNEENLNFAAVMLKLESVDLKNCIILKFKSNNSRIIEGYANATEAMNQRNSLISLLYKMAVHLVFSNSQFGYHADAHLCAVNLMACPTFTHASSSAIESLMSGAVLDRHDFLHNFAVNYLLESWRQTVDLAFVDIPPSVVVSSSKPSKSKKKTLVSIPVCLPVSNHYEQLTQEIVKKEESFCDKIIHGFGKKNTPKQIHEFFHKWSKLNPKILTFKKDLSQFGFMQSFVRERAILYNLQDISSISDPQSTPNTPDILTTSKLTGLQKFAVENIEQINSLPFTFKDLLQLLADEKQRVSLRTTCFVNCLMIPKSLLHGESSSYSPSTGEFLEYASVSSQIEQFSMKQVLNGADYPELIPKNAFLSRYANILLKGHPIYIDQQVEEILLSRCKISPFQIKQGFIALSIQQFANLESALINYHRAVKTIQSHYRRWKAQKYFHQLCDKAQHYKEMLGYNLLDFYCHSSEFKEFAKRTYFHDLERVDVTLLKKIYEESETQIPKQSQYWASLIVLEFSKPIYFSLLTHDVTYISGEIQQKRINHMALGKLEAKIESPEAKQALESLVPGFVLTCTKESNLLLEVKTNIDDTKISIWGHWLNLNRNFSGNLRSSSGVLESHSSHTIFDFNEFKTGIAEGILTKEISLDMVELQCFIPIIINGHSTSIHDSPLSILLIDYQPLESLKSPDMQREIRVKMGNLLSLGDENKTSRMWSKIHSQRHLFNKDTNLRSQIMMIQKRREAGGEIEETDQSLKFESGIERQSKTKGKKVWSAQLHQKKLFSLN